jgi:hypothetical protein
MRPGLQTIFVIGDGMSNRLFLVVFRVPPDTKIPPHSHPDERSCFVLSGIWYFGYGTVRDEDKLEALPAGSSYTEPAGPIHFAGTKGCRGDCRMHSDWTNRHNILQPDRRSSQRREIGTHVYMSPEENFRVVRLWPLRGATNAAHHQSRMLGWNLP